MRRLWVVTIFLIAVQAAATAPANASPATEAIAQTVQTFLTERAASMPGRVTVEVGTIVDNERYALCQQWDASLQEGARPWGRLSVNVRCTAGSKASLYVTANVHVVGKYLVAARPVSAGQTISADDIKAIEGEMSTQAPDLLLNEQDAIGQAARSFIPADRPLRNVMLRHEIAVVAGQPVKLLARGAGFFVANEAQALSSGAIGENIRVKAANGSIFTATVTDKGTVETK